MNSEGFEYINEEEKIEEIKEEVKEENEFIEELPDWDLEPPYTVVRRRVS